MWHCKIEFLLVVNAYSINRRLVFVMRLLDNGIAGIQTFCSLMDLCKNFSDRTYEVSVNAIKIATDSVAELVLKKAGDEEKRRTKEKSIDGKDNELSVSGDGTWAKRGFSSLIGVSTLIGKYFGKILDFFVSSKYCQKCTQMRKEKSKLEFDVWYEAEHQDECCRNHEGSSGAMEVTGMVTMFQRSNELHAVKYANYIGDGDSKTFTNILDASPYGADLIVNKLECVLHVGKRMFRHLKDLKKTITERNKFEKAKLEEKKNKLAGKSKPPPPKKQKTAEKTTNLTGNLIKIVLILWFGHPKEYSFSGCHEKRYLGHILSLYLDRRGAAA